MNILKKLWQWLTTKHEAATMTDTVVDVPVADTTTDTAAAEPEVTTTETATPAAGVKAGVQDFEAALAFVESGVAQLGEAAKDELKELAKKYL